MHTGKGAVAGLAMLLASTVEAQSEPDRPVFLADGSVQVPSFVLPPSEYLSPESVALMKSRAAVPAGTPGALEGQTIEQVRANTDRALASRVEAMKQRYPVTVENDTIGGVPVKVVKPAESRIGRRRILINLHGGAFQTCAESCALLESIPIAAVGGWTVVTVDYRQGPEHVFPAASEDVAKVYSALLRSYTASNVGVYGCSAGGVLTAEAVAWFQKENLPRPGAVGIFGASAGQIGRGDSVYISGAIDGSLSPTPREGEAPSAPRFRSYFEGADMTDPTVSPLVSPSVIAEFPPTLIVTGTRAVDLSGSVYSHYQMKKVGVDAELLVAEAQGHCYMYDSQLPESRDAYEIISRFFEEHLGN